MKYEHTLTKKTLAKDTTFWPVHVQDSGSEARRVVSQTL